MYVDESPKDGNIPDFNISKIDICPFRAYQRSFRVFHGNFSKDIHLRSRLLCFTKKDYPGQTDFKICPFLKWAQELFILPDLLVFAAWLMYAIGSKDIVLNNRVAKYLSGISMEIYLCHMMFYRVSSMLHLEKFIHNNDMLYVATCIATLIGAICFSHVIKYYVFPFVGNKISSYKK